MSAPTRVLVLGITGMLGNAMFRLLSEDPRLEVRGGARSTAAAGRFAEPLRGRIFGGFDGENADRLAELFATHRPEVVVNCVGLVKQLANANRVLDAIPINTLLPHRLLQLCTAGGARLVHISTDCVFSGKTGDYRESDQPDATDLYGLSKLLGEVAAPNAITLRTSIIGHELDSANGLLGWFLSQSGPVRGFRRAIFSGFPTVELARIVREHVLPRPELNGLYHVSADAIAKYDLLHLFAATYGRDIEIEPDDSLVIDRSLNSDRFRDATGYAPPSWPELVATMHAFG